MLITRTGWAWEYVDQLCLRKAVDLLEYWRRDAKRQADAMKKGRTKTTAEDYELDRPDFEPPSEEIMVAQFNAAPRANAMQPGFDSNISRIPPELRDMINWAEDEKAKRRIN